MSEELLVRHCAPTLMGLKTGNMFSCRFETKEDERCSLTELNRRLGEKGIRVIPLRHQSRIKRCVVECFTPGHT